jgi:hypothetical protein
MGLSAAWGVGSALDFFGGDGKALLFRRGFPGRNRLFLFALKRDYLESASCCLLANLEDEGAIKVKLELTSGSPHQKAPGRFEIPLLGIDGELRALPMMQEVAIKVATLLLLPIITE